MFAVIGAGFSGAVVARLLAERGLQVVVFESRGHVAGNCFTRRHETGVMVHVYGPHIFHTDHELVWDLIQKFGDMVPYVHRVKAMVGDQMFSLPINLMTINQFFRKNFTVDQAESFLKSKCDRDISQPSSFYDQAMKFIGPELYEAFFAGYTKKQWGTDPRNLPASVLARLPIRYSNDDRYFNHKYQAIPRYGYTPIIEEMLNHPLISLELGISFDRSSISKFEHIFWSGSIDSYFDFKFGRLAYRTLDFVEEVHDGDYQGFPVVNYCDEKIPYTRITEHKHFAKFESHTQTLIYREFSRLHQDGDIPYYPVRLARDEQQLLSYLSLARTEKDVTFLGRLGTYRYLDMDTTILEAMQVIENMFQN